MFVLPVGYRLFVTGHFVTRTFRDKTFRDKIGTPIFYNCCGKAKSW